VTGASGQVTADALIAYLAPVIEESTRTILARVVLPNPDRQWRPGQFVTAQVVAAQRDVPLVVPQTAVQPVDSRSCVFVRSDQGFAPRFVTLGRSDETAVEILSGLVSGEPVVTSGAFTLKAEWLKDTFGGDDD
jgi:cobalt-zinc-cadmium efflux system membrane fusion protein